MNINILILMELNIQQKFLEKIKKNAISFAKFCHSDSCKIIISSFKWVE